MLDAMQPNLRPRHTETHGDTPSLKDEDEKSRGPRAAEGDDLEVQCVVGWASSQFIFLVPLVASFPFVACQICSGKWSARVLTRLLPGVCDPCWSEMDDED